MRYEKSAVYKSDSFLRHIIGNLTDIKTKKVQYDEKYCTAKFLFIQCTTIKLWYLFEFDQVLSHITGNSVMENVYKQLFLISFVFFSISRQINLDTG